MRKHTPCVNVRIRTNQDLSLPSGKSEQMTLSDKLKRCTKAELITILIQYSDYVVNDGEDWDYNRQPVSLSEWLENEYTED